MRRREFIAALGTMIAWPPSVRAQQSNVAVIGFMSSRAFDESQAVLAKFHEDLGELGFVAGRNIALEYRWAYGHYDRLRALAAELVARNGAGILAAGGPPSSVAASA